MRTIRDLQLKDSDRRAIDDAARMLRDEFYAESVVLFGSKARGDDDVEAHIDLLVVTSRSLAWRVRDAITDRLYDIGLRHDVAFSTLGVSREDWKHGPNRVSPIRQEILEQGIPA